MEVIGAQATVRLYQAELTSLRPTPPLQQVLQDPSADLETLQLAVRRDLDQPILRYQMPQPRNVDQEIYQQWRDGAASTELA